MRLESKNEFSLDPKLLSVYEKESIQRMWMWNGRLLTHEAEASFKNMKQVTRPVEDHLTSLNVTQAGVHRRDGEKKCVCVFII